MCFTISSPIACGTRLWHVLVLLLLWQIASHLFKFTIHIIMVTLTHTSKIEIQKTFKWPTSFRSSVQSRTEVVQNFIFPKTDESPTHVCQSFGNVVYQQLNEASAADCPVILCPLRAFLYFISRNTEIIYNISIILIIFITAVMPVIS